MGLGTVGRDMGRIQGRPGLGGYYSVLVLNAIIVTSTAQKAPKLFQGKLSTTPQSNRNAKTIEASRKLKEPEYYDDYYYYDYYYDDPLPSGPTRRPGQPMTFKPKARNTLSPALNQFLNLPLLTTTKPRNLKTSKKVPKKKLLEKFGPFHQHFIAPPKVNAGALPLAHESNIPLNRFPPFNKPGSEKEERRR